MERKPRVAWLVSGAGIVLILAASLYVDAQQAPPPPQVESVVEVQPVNNFRNWDNEDDVDIITVRPMAITEIIVRPKRHQIAERVTSVKFVDGDSGNYGPYVISNLTALEDKTGFSFTVDTSTNTPPDEQYTEVFHPDVHHVSFWVGYKKLGRGNRPPRDASSAFGFYLTTRPY